MSRLKSSVAPISPMASTAPIEPSSSVIVNGMPIAWSPNGRNFKSNGIDSILFWLKPSLASILLPLREEVGEDLYARLIAFEASKGTSEDYGAMILARSQQFEVGFESWAHAVSAAGWGRMFLESIDWEKQEAIVRIENPWELRLSRTENIQNAVPFLSGKLSGIFSHALATNCRAEVLHLSSTSEGMPVITLVIRRSSKTLEQALIELQNNERAGEGPRLRAANNALRRNERRLLDVADTIGEFIWESDRHLNFTHVTERATTVLNRQEANLVGKNWVDLIIPAEREKLELLVRTLNRETPFVEGEFHVATTDGANRCILLRLKELVDLNGNRIGYVGSGRDIDDQKRLQSRLRDQEKLSEFGSKMATLGEMAGGMAHEINTPLAVITLLAEQLTMEVDPTSPHLGMAQTILATAERINRIVQGLKTFARDTQHDLSEQVQLNRIIEDTLTLCQARFHNHSVQLRLPTVAADVQLTCRPTQITQVLLNLLNNAYDAVSAQAEKWIELKVEVTAQQVILKVIDSGPGVPASSRDKLMQPFFTTKPVGQGTGLGLSISKGIIEGHQGKIYLDEKHPRTCFVIELPR